MPTRLAEFTPDVYQTAARRVMARCDELARVTAAPGEIERVYLSTEHARVNRLAAEWMREVGIPAKSSVSGAIVLSAPGRLGAAVVSPPLDELGTSVRGRAACDALSVELDLHAFGTAAG